MQDPLPSTLWTQVVEAGKGAPDALDALMRRYLEPVYTYVRLSGYARQDAEDLAHDFFVHVLDSSMLERADPNRGHFRGYLVTCLRNFLSSQTAKARAAKRGGGHKAVALNVEEVERTLPPQGTEVDPQEQFERSWAQSTVSRALARLHAQLTPRASQVFSLAYDSGEMPYGEIASRSGMSEDAVSASVYRSRKKMRAILLDEVRETLPEGGDAKGELQRLLDALGS